MKSVITFSKEDYGDLRISTLGALSNLDFLEQEFGSHYRINEIRRYLENAMRVIANNEIRKYFEITKGGSDGY